MTNSNENEELNYEYVIHRLRELLREQSDSRIDDAVIVIKQQAEQLESALKEIGNLQTQLGWARSNVEDSQKQIDRLSRDAERYQYLRSKSLETINEGGVFAGMTPENLILNGTDLDESIDNEIVDEALLNAAMTLCDDLRDIEADPKPEDE